MVNSNLQGWPDEAVEPAELILAEARRIGSLIDTLQVEGIKDKNYKVVDILLPLVEEKARAIKKQARRIAGKAGKRRGRPPKWSEVALDVVAQSGKIVRAMELIGPERKQNNWIVVARLVDISAGAARDIQAGMKLIPMESDGVTIPEIFNELR
jgi:hypothetical protein